MLSWVAPQLRAALVRFVARHLAPGGIAVLHYMSEPGGAAFRAFHAVFRSMADRPDPVAEGLALLQALRAAKAGFFQLYPHAGGTLDNLLVEDPAYVAHEYLNPHFTPLGFAAVQGPMAGIAHPLAGSDPAATRLNRHLHEQMRMNARIPALAAPLIGSGIAPRPTDTRHPQTDICP